MFVHPSVGRGVERQGSNRVGQTSDSCRGPSGERPLLLGLVEPTETRVRHYATHNPLRASWL